MHFKNILTNKGSDLYSTQSLLAVFRALPPLHLSLPIDKKDVMIEIRICEIISFLKYYSIWKEWGKWSGLVVYAEVTYFLG